MRIGTEFVGRSGTGGMGRMNRPDTEKTGFNSGAAGRNTDDLATKTYFRRLKRWLLISMAVAFLVPLVVLSLYFHFQFNLSLKSSGKLHLISLAESLTNTIDLFLQERVVNIFNLFHSSGFNVNPTQSQMNAFFQNLMETSSAFIDVGFLDNTGNQIGYAGPERLSRKPGAADTVPLLSVEKACHEFGNFSWAGCAVR